MKLFQDYVAAMKIFSSLLIKDEVKKASLCSGIGRIYLQVYRINTIRLCIEYSALNVTAELDQTVL